MANKDSVVKGGVSIIHKLHEGKHQYEVENVVKFKKSSGGSTFARKGDKLMLINGTSVQHITPEELAQMLSSTNPMLTMHQAGRMKASADRTCPAEGALHPFSKEHTLLRFSMEMRKEEDLEEDGTEPRGEGGQGGEREEICPTENGEKGQESDFLIVSMTNTSVSVVIGRGCDTLSPCHGCNGTGCIYNEVVMAAESSTVTLVPRGSGSFKQLKQLTNISLEHFLTQQYLRSYCLQNSLVASPSPERMTIYYYKSDGTERSTKFPVVLNFTDSNCFIKCCKDGDRVLLQVEACETQRLRQISKTDETTLSFVFYMKTTRTKKRQFESAHCPGWFIHIDNTDTVGLETQDGVEADPSFFFIIQK